MTICLALTSFLSYNFSLCYPSLLGIKFQTDKSWKHQLTGSGLLQANSLLKKTGAPRPSSAATFVSPSAWASAPAWPTSGSITQTTLRTTSRLTASSVQKYLRVATISKITSGVTWITSKRRRVTPYGHSSPADRHGARSKTGLAGDAARPCAEYRNLSPTWTTITWMSAASFARSVTRSFRPRND